MYQNIDEAEQDDAELSAPSSRAPIKWRWFALALLALTAGWVFLSNPSSQPTEPVVNAEILRAEQSTYRSALIEKSAALRRARLTDFLSTYPKSDRTDAVKSQLDVLNAKESQQRADLSEVIFDPELSRAEKLAELDRYEKDWGSTLLGGRENEIQSLREELSVDLKKFPSRKMTENKTSVPKNIEDSVLAGGPRYVAPAPKYPQPVVVAEAPIKLPPKVVTPVRLKKRVHPSYPRRAARRGISALVTVSLNIDEKGRVDDVRVVSVETERYEKDFAKSARRAAKKSRYWPKTENGVAVAVNGHVKQYTFTPG